MSLSDGLSQYPTRAPPRPAATASRARPAWPGASPGPPGRRREQVGPERLLCWAPPRSGRSAASPEACASRATTRRPGASRRRRPGRSPGPERPSSRPSAPRPATAATAEPAGPGARRGRSRRRGTRRDRCGGRSRARSPGGAPVDSAPSAGCRPRRRSAHWTARGPR